MKQRIAISAQKVSAYKNGLIVKFDADHTMAKALLRQARASGGSNLQIDGALRRVQGYQRVLNTLRGQNV